MDPKQILEEAIKRFQGKGADLGYFIGDVNEPYNQQTYGSGTKPSNATTRLYNDLVKMVADAKDISGQQADRQVQAAIAIVRQTDYTKQDPRNLSDEDVASAINTIGNSNRPVGEIIFGGQGALMNLESMKSRIASGDLKREEPKVGSEAARIAKAKADADAKRAAEAKAKADALLAGTGEKGDPLAVKPVQPDLKPGDAPMLEFTEDAKAKGLVGATNPFANIQGAEAAYAALSPAQIAAGLPSTLGGAFSPFAQQTYRRMLSPLAADSGVFDFLSVAGIAPRMAMPNDPTTVNEALSFRAFLSQDPSTITQGITQGLELLENAKTKASANMQGFLAGVGSTSQERALYQAFLEDPSKEFALRSSLAERAYPGVVGDAIKGALADQYYSTLSTNPIALSQPGFYKNAFQDYMPTGTLTNFVTSTGKELDSNTANTVEKEAVSDIADTGTQTDVKESQVNKTESVIARVTGGEEPGVRTDMTPPTDPRVVKDMTTPTPTPAPAAAATPAAAITPIAPIDPANLALDDMGGLPPIGTPPIGTTPLDIGGDPMATTTLNPMLSPAVGGEMMGERMADRQNQYSGQIQSDMQYVPPGVGNVNPLLDDLGMTPSVQPIVPGSPENMQGELLPAYTLNTDLQDMDAINYGYNQPAVYRPTDAGDYYIQADVNPLMADLGMTPSTLPPVGGEMLGERRLASTLPPAGEMINEGMANWNLGPGEMFARQFPYSPSANLMSSPAFGGEIPATRTTGFGDYNPVPQAPNMQALYRSFLTKRNMDPRKYTFDMFLRDRNNKAQPIGETFTIPDQDTVFFDPNLGRGGGLSL